MRVHSNNLTEFIETESKVETFLKNGLKEEAIHVKMRTGEQFSWTT